MAVIYAGDYQKQSDSQKALTYAAGYKWTDNYVVSDVQRPGMRELPPPPSYRQDISEAEVFQRIENQRLQEIRASQELAQAREAARMRFGGAVSKEMLTPAGTVHDVERAINAGAVSGYILDTGTRKEYFLTEKEAIARQTELVEHPFPRASGGATPSKYIMKAKGFTPYITIEGTTIYTNKPFQKDITIPKYGKMVPRGERTEPLFGVIAPDKFTDQVDKTTQELSLKIEKMNKEISDKYGLKETVSDAERIYKHAQFLAEYDPKYKKYGGGQSELGKASSEFALGFTHELAEKPLTAAGNALVTLLLTKGIGGAAAKYPILTKGVGATGLASKINLVNTLGAGLAGMYGISVAERYIEAPNKARFAGQITASEIFPFAVGGYLGTRKTPSISIKELKRGGEISYLKLVREGRILQAKTERDFERFILDESAELLKRRRVRQKLMQVHKPEVAKKAEEVEIIRADIALKKQLEAEARISQLLVSKPKYKKTYKTVIESLRHPDTSQMPMIVALNIQKSKEILQPSQKAIAVQEPTAIQKAIQKASSIQKSIAIQESTAIQEAKAIQIAQAILKAETIQKESAIQKATQILKQKPKQETLSRKKPASFKPKRFSEEVEKAYKRKKKSKWVWDVNNPVPTLEQVLGG